MHIQDAFEEYVLACRQHAKQTLRYYTQKGNVFCGWAVAHEKDELGSLTPRDIRHFLAWLEEHPPSGRSVSSYTLRGYIMVVKGFLTFCEKDGLGVQEGLSRRITLPKVETKVIATLTTAHIQALMRAASSTSTPLRDRAILSVLLDCGLRASELCQLTLEHTHLETTDSYLHVLGKGRKERTVPIGGQARHALSRYLLRERGTPRLSNTFVARGDKPLDVRGLEDLMDRLNEQAHITGVRVSPHTCRHTFALSYLRSGGSVYTLSRLMGHSGVQVTEHYLRDFQMEDMRADHISVLESLLR